MNITKKSLKQYCDEIEIWDGWRDNYKRFVPKFINEAKTKNNWQDWDKDVFFEFFEHSNDQCVSSLQQGYFTKKEQQNIKSNWNEIAPLLKTLAENQEEPQWQTYQQIKKTIRKYTNLDRKAATNRIVASLQPNLLCTVVNEGNLWELFDRLNKYSTDEIPDFVGDNWFKNSYNLCELFQKILQPKNAMDIITYPWQMFEYLRELQEKQTNMNNYIQEKTELLKEVHNLIFTGAPGTGKTYLAKQITKQMNAEWEFIQFHPSYDYTDFVEGLRPTEPDENGNIGFELKNGVLKEFCKRAKTKKTSNFDEIYEQFIEDVSQNPIDFETPTLKRKFNVKIGKMKGCWAIPQTEKATEMSITKEMIRNYIENGEIRDWKPYTTGIGDYIKSKYKIDTKDVAEDKKYVFIIDEINRGEISKIFGELFFSIDPSYRGEKGSVKTQYSNLHNDESELFYIPENVYIIGTMNDIDRSVESFDFAMRRRFTWIEITAEQSAENMNLPADTKERMKSLNNQISKMEGLNTSYHIGGAYFLDKNGSPRTDYDAIWQFRLEPLLKEYLRGMSEIEKKLEELKKAYNAETDNGQ